jgi:hypothetical protein
MTGYGSLRHSRAFPATRNVIGFQPIRIEHLFETADRSVVQEQRTVPEAAQRRDLVKPRTFARLHRQARIGADRDVHYVSFVRVIGRSVVALSERELSARIVGRHVAFYAGFASEDFSAALAELRERRKGSFVARAMTGICQLHQVLHRRSALVPCAVQVRESCNNRTPSSLRPRRMPHIGLRPPGRAADECRSRPCTGYTGAYSSRESYWCKRGYHAPG